MSDSTSVRDPNFVPGGTIGVIEQLDLIDARPITVAIVDGAGDQITSFGGGTQYADGAARGSAIGTIAMGDDGTNIQSIHVDSSGDLQIDVLTMPTVTVTGTFWQATQPVSLATNTPTLQSGSTTAVTQATGTNLHMVVDSGTITTVSALGVGTTGPQKAEDVAHSSGDMGIAVWGVRNDANTARSDSDGDYTPISTDSEGSVRTLGNRAHDDVDSGRPIKIGYKAYSPDGTTPGTAVAENDRTDAKADLDGRLFINDEHPRFWSYHEDSSSALTDTTVQADPGDGFQIVITDIIVSTGAATALNFFLEEGASKIWGPIYLEAVAGRGFVWKGKKHVTASTAVTITTSAAIAHAIDILGYIQAV
jgi:hypothetical protein